MTSTLKSERVGILEIAALKRWVHSRCGRHFNVRFDTTVPTAYVDTGGNMVIPAPNANATIRDLIRLRGFCIHECGHPEWQPEIFDVLTAKKVPSDSPLAGIYNLLTDVHSESMTAARYPGDAKALSEFAAVVGHDMYDRMAPEFTKNSGKWPDNFARFVPMVIAARNTEATWNIGMEIGFAKVINDLYTQEMRDKGKVISDKFNLVDRLITNGLDENAWTLWDLALDIFKFMYPEENPEDHQGGGKGEPSDEKGEEGAPSSAAEGSDSGESNGKPEGKDGKEGKSKPREKIKLDELLFSDHYERYSSGPDAGSGMGFDYSEHTSYDVYSPVDPATFKVVSYRNRGR